MASLVCGCGKWSHALTEEQRQRIFQNRILRKIFGTKWNENGKWIKLHDEEVHTLYHSHNMIRVIKSRILR